MDRDQYFRDIRGKTVCFIGFGVSHQDLAAFYLKKGAKVVVCDRKRQEDFPQADELELAGVTLHLGEDYLSHLKGDYIFRTPGLSFFTPELISARQAGKVITSELETFFALCPCPIYGVTGSDGKTTTTTLIARMLEASGHRVHLGGNIGMPLLPRIDEIKKDHVVVVELSSFQLISMRQSPQVAVVTNLAPNHLDAHADMDEYVNAKRNIYLHQHGGTRTVLNADNAITFSFAAGVRDEPAFFSLSGKAPQKGAYLRSDGMLSMMWDGKETSLFHKDRIKIPGMHNVDNVLAAVTALWGAVSLPVMEQVVQEFSGVEHRIEFVREVGGIRWYNDSIATSPTRTMACLAAFDQRIILLAGGYDKQVPFAPLAPALIEKVKSLYLMGPTADKIEQAVIQCPEYQPDRLRIVRVGSLEEGVKQAQAEGNPGDVAVLSPASASFDRFRNFEEKGRAFKAMVQAL